MNPVLQYSTVFTKWNTQWYLKKWHTKCKPWNENV